MKTMKCNSKRRIFRYVRGVILSLGIMWYGAAVFGQYYASQGGRLLDANPRVGSLGINSARNYDYLLPRSNLFITGNVRGGSRFQGNIPYRSPYEFQGTLGSSSLSNFRRDSVGAGNLGGVNSGITPYVDPSRSITSMYGPNVVRTNQINQFLPMRSGAASATTNLIGRSLSSQALKQSFNVGASGITGMRKMRQFGDSSIKQQRWSLTNTREDQLGSRLNNPLKSTKNLEIETPETQTAQTTQTAENDKTGNTNTGVINTVEDMTSQEQAQANLDQFMPQQQQDQTPQVPAVLPAARTGRITASGGGASALLSAADMKLKPRQYKNIPRFVLPKVKTAPIEQKNPEKFNRQQYAEYMKEGRKYLARHKYYLAADAFDTAVLYDVKNPEAYLAKAEAMFAAGEYVPAALLLKQAYVLDKKILAKPLDLQAVFADPKQCDERVNELRKWQNDYGQSILKFLLSYVLYQQGKLKEATLMLQDSLAVHPDSDIIKTLLQIVKDKQK